MPVLEVSTLLHHDFVAHVTRFCRALRGQGLLVGPQETADALRAIGLVDFMDRRRAYWTLRCVLVSRREEVPAFDTLFDRFWDFEPSREQRDTPFLHPALHLEGKVEGRLERKGKGRLGPNDKLWPR